MARYDIRISKAYINANNDVEIFESDMAHVKSIINASKGSFKQSPSIGCEVLRYVNSVGRENELARNIIIQLRTDGYQSINPTVDTTNGKLTITPNVVL